MAAPPAAVCVVRTAAALTEALSPLRGRGPVVLVPTMGALHEGHVALLRRARELAGADGSVVVSIFVNPLQFGPLEDFDRYPRDLDRDLAICAREGAAVVFAPEVAAMYPAGVPHEHASSRHPAVTVAPGPIAEILEGTTRPGHFRGVLTVVAKLFGQFRPDVAVFGEKDYQQLALIRRMTEDLCLGVEIVAVATDRDPDGLARSSRNEYLSAEDRRNALALSRALRAAEDAAAHGAPAALAAGRAVLDAAAGVEVDYFVVLGADLAPLPPAAAPGTPARALVAARVGGTRLIDNVALILGGAAFDDVDSHDADSHSDTTSEGNPR